MKVTYIGHSGFSVELERSVLLFDYYTGKLPQWPKDKALFVFASHSHPDHFNWKILHLAEEYSRIHYFFGNDIRLGEKWLRDKGIDPSIKEKVTRLSGGKNITWEQDGIQMEVSTLTSTDQGVAFCLATEGKRIYHAGDLNWWHWEGEPEEDNAAMGKAYCEQIDRLAGQHFDLAFIPLDPRLEESFDWGLSYFLKKADAENIFPMHLWGKYDTIDKYLQTPEGARHTACIRRMETGGTEWNI